MKNRKKLSKSPFSTAFPLKTEKFTAFWPEWQSCFPTWRICQRAFLELFHSCRWVFDNCCWQPRVRASRKLHSFCVPRHCVVLIGSRCFDASRADLAPTALVFPALLWRSLLSCYLRCFDTSALLTRRFSCCAIWFCVSRCLGMRRVVITQLDIVLMAIGHTWTLCRMTCNYLRVACASVITHEHCAVRRGNYSHGAVHGAVIVLM